MNTVKPTLSTLECLHVYFTSSGFGEIIPWLEDDGMDYALYDLTDLRITGSVSGLIPNPEPTRLPPSLTNISLTTTHVSNFVELASPLHVLRRLTIHHNEYVYRPIGVSLFKALLRLLKQRHELVPRLEEISIHWSLKKDLTVRRIAKTLAYCMSQKCNSEGIVLNVTIRLSKLRLLPGYGLGLITISAVRK